MKPGHYIQRNWRLLCTSIALLLVLTVNHRALPAYASTLPVERTEVKKQGRDADSSVVKQKVSFEATTSYVDFQAAEPTLFPHFMLVPPAPQENTPPVEAAYWTYYLQQLATLAISPNAP
ncbi:hypothetical protein [Rufibacter immobilis]|uniref:hypothetical protein n=1 Tax=Rufibacter immobilis TaxID=1348778 RepID=UPI0035E90CFE